MKTETPPTPTPTIAELWGEFEEMTVTGNPCYLHSREGEQWEAMFQSLRQQLVERCSELVDCTDGHFSINQKLIMRLSHGITEAFGEASAIFAFWEYELEQREKEASNG